MSIKLVDGLSSIAGLDAKVIIDTGATALRSVVPETNISVVVREYSYALTRVFIIVTVFYPAMILPASAAEWKSIKQEKKGDTKMEEESTSKDGNLVEGKKEIKDGHKESGAEDDSEPRHRTDQRCIMVHEKWWFWRLSKTSTTRNQARHSMDFMT